MKNIQKINQNIYITSDEEIKVGDWMIRGNEQSTLVTPNFFWDFRVRYYKIILTTDQDLINDGVQAIDDEFLEWFVKNPNCEEVEVVLDDLCFISSNYEKNYKIMIPKEEPKQEIKLEDVFNDEKRQGVKDLIDKHKQKLEVTDLPSKSNLIITDLSKSVRYEVLIADKDGNKLVFKQEGKWVINAPIEEVLDYMIELLKNK